MDLVKRLLVPLVVLAAWREQGGDTGRLRHYLALVLVQAPVDLQDRGVGQLGAARGGGAGW